MTMRQDWEEYARLVTRVGTAGASERRRQDERRVRRTREREESEQDLKLFAEWREDLKERTASLQAYADSVLSDAGVSPSGEIEPANVGAEYATSTELADAMDEVGDELHRVAQQLWQAREQQGRRRTLLVTLGVLNVLPLAAAGAVLFSAGASPPEALVAAVFVLAAAGFVRWSRQSAFLSLITGVVVGLIVYAVIAAFARVLTVLSLGILAVFLVSVFVRVVRDYYRRDR